MDQMDTRSRSEREEKADDASPPYDDLQEGIYVLVNKAGRTVLDLDRGSSGGTANGCKIQGYKRVHNECFSAARWVLRRLVNENWTLANLNTGTFLDLKGGSPKPGSHVVSWKHRHDNLETLNRQWIINRKDGGCHTIQNVRSRTFLELENGSSANGTWAVCSALVEGDEKQQWTFEKASRNTEEIIALLGDWNEPLLSRLCQPRSLDTHYFVLPNELRQTIWEGTGLRTQPVRKNVFDHDHFAIKAKDAMVSRVRDDFKSEGYGLLFGLLYGQAEQGPTAYNWYLSQDLESLVFFDPQTGTEYMPPTLKKRGFRPSFIVF